MPEAIKQAGRIVIRGMVFDQEYFAPHPIDEFTLQEVIPHISDVGEIARIGSKDLESLVGNSPLTYIEGLIRYQLKRIDDALALCFSELDCLVSFDNYHDLIHERPLEIPDSKIVFLFDFLRDIVILSRYPDKIRSSDLEKISVNLRALSFLIEPQLNGKIKPNNHAFEYFAYGVWLRAGGKKITGKQFFNSAIRLIQNNNGEIEFKYRRWEWEPLLTYVATVGQSEHKPVIKVECEKPGVNAGKPKSLGQINNIWSSLQNKFIERVKRNSA